MAASDSLAPNASLAALRQQVRGIVSGSRPSRAVLPLGIDAIDRALPGGGLPRGGLHEIQGEAAVRLGFVAALLARQSSPDPILWCRAGEAAGVLPHAPGLAGTGLAPERLLVIRVRRESDALWAMEEGLRCRRIAAVLGEGVTPSPVASRRLQLAAESGETPALLLLSPTARPPPSVALTRWRVAAVPGDETRSGILGRSRWRLTLDRCRGGGRGEWMVEWDDETLRLDLAAVLAGRLLVAAE